MSCFACVWAFRASATSLFSLDSHLKDSKNHIVIHDLRLEVDSDVVQIDHLVFYRADGMHLFENKKFNGSLFIKLSQRVDHQLRAGEIGHHQMIEPKVGHQNKARKYLLS